MVNLITRPDLEQLIQDTRHYLKEIGVLDGKPVFEKTKPEFVCVDPRGEWEEYWELPPYWQWREREFHRSAFETIDSRLPRTSRDEVQEEALREIPDTKNTVIIELGSEYGERGAGYLAAYKPNTTVILISKPEKIIISPKYPPKYLFMESKLKHRLTFTRGIELLSEPNIELRINQLYWVNGIRNVRYYSHELMLDEMSESKLPAFIREVRGKNIYLFGHRANRTLPFLIGLLYNEINARQMCISLTGQEKVPAQAFTWAIIQKNLGLSDEEIKGYIESTFDPTGSSGQRKYDYDNRGKNEEQRRIGVMIKLGIALALAKEVNGVVLRNTTLDWDGYNQADHYVQARR